MEIPVRPEEVRLPPPTYTRAFDHPETRAAWEGLYRKLRRRRIIWWILCLPSFLAVSLLRLPEAGKAVNVIGGIALISWVLAYPCVLYLSGKSFGCVKRMRSVLEAHPWRLIPQVHRPKGHRDAYTAAVQLRYAEGERLTGVMSVWNPARTYRRWPETMQYGAWYAGDTFNARITASQGRGVLTLPGLGDLLSVTHRSGNH